MELALTTMKALLRIAAKEAGRYRINAVQVSRKDGQATCAATDGQRLCRITWPDFGSDFEILVPRHAIERATQIEFGRRAVFVVTEVAPFEISVLGDSGDTSTPKVMLAIPFECDVGIFPKIDPVIPKDFTNYSISPVNPEYLADLIDVIRANAAAQESSYSPRVLFKIHTDSINRPLVLEGTCEGGGNGGKIECVLMPTSPSND